MDDWQVSRAALCAHWVDAVKNIRSDVLASISTLNAHRRGAITTDGFFFGTWTTGKFRERHYVHTGWTLSRTSDLMFLHRSPPLMRTAGAQLRRTGFSSGHGRLASFASGIMCTLGGRCQEHPI